MKRLDVALLAVALFVPSFAVAEQIVMTKAPPTKTVGSTWHDFADGSYNGNLWMNVWPADGAIGGYGFLQAADGYTQSYGGVAVRNRTLEVGAGLGVENIIGEVGLRTSVYTIATVGRFQSANWYEHSNQGGWWGLSQNLYGVDPGRLDLGFRFQRHLGGGPMGRMTLPNVGRLQLQVYLATLYDGDGFNPIIGSAVNF